MPHSFRPFTTRDGSVACADCHATKDDPEHTPPNVPRFFVQLKAHGLADAGGKTVMGIEMSTKRVIAEPDAPVALVVAILEEWQNGWKYSSVEAGKKDIARLRAFVDNMTFEA